MTERPKIEDLVVPSLVEIIYGAFDNMEWPVDEAEVTKCLDPRVPMQQRDKRTQSHYVIGLVRTASLFVVSSRETTDVIRSAGEYPMNELPRLPYARVAIEPRETTGWLLQAAVFGGQDILAHEEVRTEDTLEVYALFISERVPGQIWDCMWYWSPFDYQNPRFEVDVFIQYTLRASDDGIEVLNTFDMKPLESATGDKRLEEIMLVEDNGPVHALIRAFTIELANIIGARNVPHEAIKPDRHERRRTARRFAKSKIDVANATPIAYYVNLAQAGETTAPQGGNGHREYHCRWLVRGHWRHYTADSGARSGRSFSERSTWVHAHVKGPVGAPWKGRPVYIEKEQSDRTGTH